jgi:hypothetical protein
MAFLSVMVRLTLSPVVPFTNICDIPWHCKNFAYSLIDNRLISLKVRCYNLHNNTTLSEHRLTMCVGQWLNLRHCDVA